MSKPWTVSCMEWKRSRRRPVRTRRESFRRWKILCAPGGGLYSSATMGGGTSRASRGGGRELRGVEAPRRRGGRAVQLGHHGGGHLADVEERPPRPRVGEA